LQTREAINTEFRRRRHEIPVPTELNWDGEKPQFTISSRWLSFIVQFTPEQLVVDAEMTLAAKAFATRENRATAVRLIDSVSEALGL
jgi:hypothetical protein